MYHVLKPHKDDILVSEFLECVDLHSTDLRYIAEFDVTKELLKQQRLTIYQMMQIGGDAYAQFEGCVSVEDFYRKKGLRDIDTSNPKYYKYLRAIHVAMTDTFIAFCKHVKYAIEHEMLNKKKFKNI